MAVPDQVRRDAERAQALFDQVNAPPAEPAPAEQQEPQEPQAPTIQLAPEDPPADPAPAEPAAAPQEDWEHKYRTLQGVFNAHKRDSDARLTAMEARLAAQPAPAPAPAPTPAAAPANSYSEKDVETYGQELLDVIDRRAEAKAAQRIAEMQAELQPQLEQTRAQVTEFGQQVYATKADQFYGELATEVPDWKALNQDPRFLDWLAEVDPLSGVSRQVYMDKAGQDLNHGQAANLFKAFKTASGMNKPPPAPQAAPTARLSPSPRTANAASAPTHNEPDLSVSRSQIAAHYARGARDTDYRRSAEHAAMETKIQTATANNQVTEA